MTISQKFTVKITEEQDPHAASFVIDFLFDFLFGGPVNLRSVQHSQASWWPPGPTAESGR
jgi:hypothetical protein